MQMFWTALNLNSWHPKYMQNFKTKLEVEMSILLHGMKIANLKTISFIFKKTLKLVKGRRSCHNSSKSHFSNYLKTEKIWIDSLLPSSSLLILERARLL